MIALRSNSARLMTCTQFGQTCTLSHDSAGFGSVLPAFISPFHCGRFSVELFLTKWFGSPIDRYSGLSEAALDTVDWILWKWDTVSVMPPPQKFSASPR